jgi:hypothetical protein
MIMSHQGCQMERLRPQSQIQILMLRLRRPLFPQSVNDNFPEAKSARVTLNEIKFSSCEAQGIKKWSITMSGSHDFQKLHDQKLRHHQQLPWLTFQERKTAFCSDCPIACQEYRVSAKRRRDEHLLASHQIFRHYSEVTNIYGIALG